MQIRIRFAILVLCHKDLDFSLMLPYTGEGKLRCYNCEL
jgi:hypothetical protein